MPAAFFPHRLVVVDGLCLCYFDGKFGEQVHLGTRAVKRVGAADHHLIKHHLFSALKTQSNACLLISMNRVAASPVSCLPNATSCSESFATMTSCLRCHAIHLMHLARTTLSCIKYTALEGQLVDPDQRANEAFWTIPEVTPPTQARQYDIFLRRYWCIAASTILRQPANRRSPTGQPFLAAADEDSAFDAAKPERRIDRPRSG